MDSPAPPPSSTPARAVCAVALAVGLPAVAILAALPFVQIGDGAHVPRLVLFLGRFHPTVLHLPVAFLLLALFLECLRLPGVRKLAPALPDAAIHLVVWLAALAGFVAAVAGWLLGHEGGYDPDLLDRHLWTGVATGIGAMGCALLRSFAAARPDCLIRRRLAGAAVVVTCGVMVFAAHAGAGLTHGEDYLTQYAPRPLRRLLGLPIPRDRSGEPLKAIEERAAFADVVQPIFENRCLSCHNEGKRKGGLRLDTFAGIQKGGRSGPVVQKDDSGSTEILRRLRLPPDDKEHMPPKGKSQPSTEELAVLEWWVTSGAPDAVPVADIKTPPETRAAIESLIPEAERKALEERGRQEMIRYEAALAALRKTVPGALRPIQPGSRELELTAAIAGKSFGDAELNRLAAVGADLVWLDLSRTGVTDAGLKALAKMPNLKRLDLRGTAVGDAGLKALAGLAKLETLGLYGTSVTDAGLDALRGLKDLRRLYLGSTKATEAGVKRLREALPELGIVP